MFDRKIGPLLSRALHQIETATSDREVALIASEINEDDSTDCLPVVIKLRDIRPEQGKTWSDYRERVTEYLEPLRSKCHEVMGMESELLIAANALQTKLRPDQIDLISREEKVVLIELDPLLPLTQMDDASRDIDRPAFQAINSGGDGTGVTVAVLDSGIDTRHPFLKVAASISTCVESINIPGSHGTHCAGVIASQDNLYSGIAPGVRLLNIKVLRANGIGKHTDVTKGVDEALDRNAHVLSLSLGFNHLPSWSDSGHGWACSNARCPLCTAVANAVALDNVIVVAAAGNDHERVEALRRWGYGHYCDTEISCPGQSPHAITVGAVTKKPFLPAPFSSHGPTAFGHDKPDVCAPGVNVTSTTPVPRNARGRPQSNPPRGHLFRRMSGTSMATPMVAAAVALIIQKRMNQGQLWNPASVKRELLSRGIHQLSHSKTVVGDGCLNLSGL